MIDDPPPALPLLTERAKSLQRQFVSYDEIEPRLDNNYLVQGWLGTGGLSILYGPSNSGKTFVAIDLAVHVASGYQWHGNTVRPGPVIYIAGEGGPGILNRFAATRKKYPMLRANSGLHLLPTNLDLFAPNDASELCYTMPVDGAALIIVDTMARSMGAGDENSARDVAQFVSSCDFIRERTGAHVLIVHHTGKNVQAGARGSSALRAAVDTEISIFDHKIFSTKQRDMEISKHLFFDLQSVALGVDQDGVSVTSAVVVPADPPTGKAKELSHREMVAFQALEEILELHGTTQSGETMPNNRNVVEVFRWQIQCKENGLAGPGASKDANRKAFGRAKKSLLERNFIEASGEYVWKVPHDD
ncbi:AAA family ATPase [Falsihalocynthiibacter sp. CO-5D18]|uniref:AAA family ATPase n=1 Tax=Falsihalocynthiibacter sp. CO-5D18 TaxID=3240872 RepID=UPI00350E9FEB